MPALLVKLQHWVFDDPRRAPFGLPTLPMGIHKFINTKFMIPDEYKKFKTYDKRIADVVGSRKDAKTHTLFSENLSTPCIDNFLLYDQLLEAEVNHSPLLPSLICQSPLFKKILHPTLPSSQRIRFVGPAVVEKKDQISGETRSFGNNSIRKKIQEFIASNVQQKPVYIGWGSMIRKSTHGMVIFAVEALMMSNKRGIVLGGSAGLNMEVLEEAVGANNDHREKLIEYAKENVIFVSQAPHEWLFPQVSLTVHHGGAGTTNAALRSGVPTIITPVFGDQCDHSFLVQNLGVGVGFKQQLQKMDTKDLSKAIETVTNNPAIAKKAKEVGDQIRNECGCRAIVEEVEKYWTEEVTTGRLFEDINDWKVATKEMKSRNAKKTLRSRVVLGSALVVASIAFLIKSS